MTKKNSLGDRQISTQNKIQMIQKIFKESVKMNMKQQRKQKKNYTHTKYSNEKYRISDICKCTNEQIPVIHLIKSVVRINQT